MDSDQIKKVIVQRGVKNLEEFGYEYVNEENIFTDIVYSQFFLSMLKENLGYEYDKPINELIAQIKTDKE